MTAIRTFIAIDINQSAKQKISCLIDQLTRSNADAKWITENQMHFTLKFLGQTDELLIPKISEALKSLVENFGEFTISFSDIGAFPNIKRPRVIWLGIDKGKDKLELLNGKIETALEKLGFEKEKRQFTAHLTLGRVRSLKNIEGLKALIDKMDIRLEDEIKANKVILYRSTLSPKGAIYTPLVELPLR